MRGLICMLKASLARFLGTQKRGGSRQLPLLATGIRLISPIARQIVLALSPNRSDGCDDRNRVKEKLNACEEGCPDQEGGHQGEG
jgi:hypothetical protein